MKPAPFEYHAPSSPADVVSLLAEYGDGAKIIAGGQSLTPMLALRLAVFEHLVDVGRVTGLREIEDLGSSVRIGAGTTQAAIEQSVLVAGAVPLLARATPLIGHFQIRNRGTIGGSLAHADAAAEYPAVALVLDATVETLSPRGQRAIPASRFFTGIWSTDLAADELITGVRFPVRDGASGFAIEEFAARRGDFAIAGAAIAVEVDTGADAPRIRQAAIGLFGLGPTPLRAEAAEGSLAGARVGDMTAEEVGHAAVSELHSVPSGLHASAEYRKRVGVAVVAAAWQRALQEAVSG